MTSSSAPAAISQVSEPASGPQVVIEDVTALRHARRNILQRFEGDLATVLVEHGNPTFRATASEPLGSLVAQPVTQGGTGTGQASLSSSGLQSASTSSASAPSFSSLQLRLIAVYLYDTYDRRILRMVEGWPIFYYAWDGWEEAQEMTATFHQGQLVTRAITQNAWGRELDEMVAYRHREVGLSGTTTQWADYYVAEGGAHCPSRILNGQGAVVEIQEYDPYGKTTFFDGAGALRGEYSDIGIWNRFHWKGHRVDWETGLVYMRHRYYSPTWSRFVSADPLGDWADAHNWGNGYAYAGARPLTQHDAYGLQTIADSPVTFDAVPSGDGFVAQFDRRDTEDGPIVESKWLDVGDWVRSGRKVTEGDVHARWAQDECAPSAGDLWLHAFNSWRRDIAPMVTAYITGFNSHPLGQATLLALQGDIGGALAIAAEEAAWSAGALVGVGLLAKAADKLHDLSKLEKVAEKTATAAETAAKLGDEVAEGIYEFKAASGKTYVGQSGNIDKRLAQHTKSGKLPPGAAVERTQVPGGKTAREVAEQQRINELGGIQSGNLENKVNPIGPNRAHLLR